MSYAMLAGAAMLTRALAGFLGLATRNGELCQDDSYFQHERGKSWEVKLSDLNGGKCISLESLTSDERTKIRDGMNETNRAFAHFTFWSDVRNQEPNTSAKPDYANAQRKRIHDFAETIIHIIGKQVQTISPE